MFSLFFSFLSSFFFRFFVCLLCCSDLVLLTLATDGVIRFWRLSSPHLPAFPLTNPALHWFIGHEMSAPASAQGTHDYVGVAWLAYFERRYELLSRGKNADPTARVVTVDRQGHVTLWYVAGVTHCFFCWLICLFLFMRHSTPTTTTTQAHQALIRAAAHQSPGHSDRHAPARSGRPQRSRKLSDELLPCHLVLTQNGTLCFVPYISAFADCERVLFFGCSVLFYQ